MARRCGPSTTPIGRGPPPHRFATGRIAMSASHPKLAPVIAYVVHTFPWFFLSPSVLSRILRDGGRADAVGAHIIRYAIERRPCRLR